MRVVGLGRCGKGWQDHPAHRPRERHRRESELPVYEFPTKCPACDSELVKDAQGVYIRCVSKECPALWRQRLRYFFNQRLHGYEGLGEKLVNQLVDANMVSNFGELYALKLDRLMTLERMGKKSAENLLAGIEASKSRGLSRVLMQFPFVMWDSELLRY